MADYDLYLISKWTDEEIQKQLKRANYWNKQTDLSNAIVKEMLNNPVINYGLSLYTQPLKSAQWSIEHEKEDVALFLTDAIKAQYVQIAALMRDCLAYGYKAAELLYRFENGLWSLANVMDCKPEDTALEAGEWGEPIAVCGGVRLPIFKSVVLRYNYSDTYPYGISMLRPAYKAWFGSELVELSSVRHAERLAGQQMIIEYPAREELDSSGAVVDVNKQAAMNMATSINKDRCLVVSSSESGQPKWDVREVSKAAQTANFKIALDRYERMMYQAMLIPDRLVNNTGSSGSRADQEGKQDIFYLTLEGVMTEMESIISNRILKPLLTLQYGENESPAYFRYAPLSDDRRDIVDTLLIAGYNSNKIIIDSNWLKAQREINDGILQTINEEGVPNE